MAASTIHLMRRWAHLMDQRWWEERECETMDSKEIKALAQALVTAAEDENEAQTRYKEAERRLAEARTAKLNALTPLWGLVGNNVREACVRLDTATIVVRYSVGTRDQPVEARVLVTVFRLDGTVALNEWSRQ
jgi:hypothetical protein